MKLDYFAAFPDQIPLLAAACASWAGTPFRKYSRVKGPLGGVDCEAYSPCVMLECTAISELEFAAIDFPRYDLNHAEHSEQSHFHAFFAQPAVRVRVRRVEEEESHVDGDFVFPKVGRTEHHMGIRVGQLVWHVVRQSGVCSQTVSSLTLHRSRYRLLAP